MFSTIPGTWQVLKGKLLFPCSPSSPLGKSSKWFEQCLCFFTFCSLPLPNKTWGNPCVQDLTFMTYKGHHHRLMFPYCPAYAPNCLFAGHLPVSLTALLWALRNDISQMPNWLSSETLTLRGGQKGRGCFSPLWLGLGCSSAISQLPPGSPPPLRILGSRNTSSHVLIGTRSDKRFPTVGISGLPTLWITCVTVPILHFLKWCVFLPGPNWQISAKPN